MNLFSTPYSVPIDDLPGRMQMEIIYVQCNGGLKEKYSNARLFDVYSKCNDTNTFAAVH
jgi:hypothetical protein